MDEQPIQSMEELAKKMEDPKFVEGIVKRVEEMHRKQDECGKTTGHANEHVWSINYSAWRANYTCQDCHAVGERPLNKKETEEYCRIMSQPMTI